MQMFCAVVIPSAQLGVCSDAGEALLSQVGPCSVVAEALTDGGKVLAVAGTKGKPFVENPFFSYSHNDRVRKLVFIILKFPSVLLSFILNLD